MNDIAMMDKNVSVERTPELIAIEINSIKEQMRKIFLFNSIEIGRKLAEAKLMLPHGEWGEWLCKSVDYSQRTASNLMAIFEQYGSSQITFFCDNAKSQALANLSYTQAVALLGIPQGERETFIQEHDIDNMSTRELQQAIKDKQELEAKLREVEAGWEGSKRVADNAKRMAEEKDEEARKLLEEKQSVESNLRVTNKCLRDTQADVKMLQDALGKEKDESKKEIERLGASISETKKLLAESETSGNNDEVERLEKSLEETVKELSASIKKNQELELQIKEPIEVTAAQVIEKIPEEIERELNELREKTKDLEAKGQQGSDETILKYTICFKILVKGFEDLLGTLAEIEKIDPEACEKRKGATRKLIGIMSERL